METQRHFKQTSTFEFLSTQEASNLRKQAEGMPHGIRRDELLRKARQVDIAFPINKWLNSPELRAPT